MDSVCEITIFIKWLSVNSSKFAFYSIQKFVKLMNIEIIGFFFHF